MYREISKLIMYGDMDKDCILYQFGEIFRHYENKTKDQAQLIQDIYTQVKRLLVVATDYGFDHNLWHNYLAFYLVTNENPFSITCEKVGANDGSVNHFAKNDFTVIKNLFDYDFSKIEADLGIDCFSQLSDYHAIQKKELMYNKNVSEKIIALSAQLEAAEDVDAFFAAVTGFYKDYGVGMFGLNKAFRIKEKDGGDVEFVAINNMDKVMLDDLIGYEIQKKKLVDNTKAFVEGRAANNVLLYGDAGTGKSSTVKAIANEYAADGLRLVEVKKNQLYQIPDLMDQLAANPLKFILFIDDLSFSSNDDNFAALKAILEGSVGGRARNIAVYATSNRRHLIKETLSDRTGDDIHEADTRQELMSLSARFGLTVTFQRPEKARFEVILTELAKQHGIEMPHDELLTKAEAFAIRAGGRSPRVAKQFIEQCAAGVQK